MMAHDDARLETAVQRGIITAEQAAAIRGLAPSAGSPGVSSEAPTFQLPRVNAAIIAYVLGAITVVVAMAWFLSDRWEWLGAWGVIVTCALYAALFLVAARRLRREGFAMAEGFATLLAVAMVPPAVAASNEVFQWFTPFAATGCYGSDFLFWPCRGEEFVVELATAAAALFALRHVRFSLLVVPIAGIAVRMLFHVADAWGRHGLGDETSGWILAAGSSLLLAAAYATERRQAGDQDFARWLHIAAVLCAAAATLQLLARVEWLRHLLVPGAFVAFAAALILRRLPWLLLGMGWFVGYVAWLAADVFRDTPAFPIVLAALGVAVIIATVWVQRNADRLVQRFGTVTSDGRPRFPGGVALLALPAMVALTMVGPAIQDDAERHREWTWIQRRVSHRAAAERQRQRREGTAPTPGKETLPSVRP